MVVGMPTKTIVLILLGLDTCDCTNHDKVLSLPKFYHPPLPNEVLSLIRPTRIWKQALIEKITADVEDPRLQWIDGLGSSANKICMLASRSVVPCSLCLWRARRSGMRAGEYTYCQSNTKNL